MAPAKILPTTVPIATPAVIGSPTVVEIVVIVAATAVYAADPLTFFETVLIVALAVAAVYSADHPTVLINVPPPVPNIVVKNEAIMDNSWFD